MATEGIANERWKRAVIALPPDFLRLTTPREIQLDVDRQAAYALQQQQQIVASPYAQNICGRLSLTVAQAKLFKNYGLLTMDPYVRVRIGHFVYETQTDNNGGKNPRWNRVFHTQLPKGVSTINLEIFDECNFTMDELIAWTEIRIPDVVLAGETHEDWYQLNGKLGDGKEGMIDIVLSFSPQTAAQMGQMYQNPIQPVMMVPNVSGRALPVFITPQQQQPLQVVQQQIPQQQQMPLQPEQPPPQLTETDLVQIQEMFPNCDKEVIKSIAEVNRGSKEATINSLLQMAV